MIIKNNRYKIYTPEGFKDFYGIRKLSKNSHFIISFNNDKIIKCSLTHIFISNGDEVKANELTIGSTLDCVDGTFVVITNIEFIHEEIDLYDIIEVDGGNLFIVDDGLISHNCDFATSGGQVVSYMLLEEQRINNIIDPIEKQFDDSLWIWQRPNYSKSYMVTADCARGDGSDYSAFHVIDIELSEQVAEYKGRIDTTEYGNFLVSIATQYNDALLVVENNNIGWATIQAILNRNYSNLYHSEIDLSYIDDRKKMQSQLNRIQKKSVPGHTTTNKNRPLMISKMESYYNDKSIIMRSSRLYDELCVFIWNGSRAEAMSGYNDDLVTSLMQGLWIRDTALKLQSDRREYNKLMLNNIQRISSNLPYKPSIQYNDPMKSWKQNTGKDNEDLSWLL